MARMYKYLHTCIAFIFVSLYYFVLNLFIFVLVFSKISQNYQICIHIATVRKKIFVFVLVLKMVFE